MMTSRLNNARTITPPVAQWTAYIEQTLGFVLPKSQENWLITAVNTLASTHQMTTDYLYQNLDDPILHQALIDAVLITESRFFRDMTALQAIIAAYREHLKHASTPFLVMSVGAATGQEVWSIAMLLSEERLAYQALTGKMAAEFQIVGVDASQESLKIAKSGCYAAKDMLQITAPCQKYVALIDNKLMIDRALHSTVQFLHCNVFASTQMAQLLQGFEAKVDVLICQNMLIYFRKFDQRDILANFLALLKSRGYLVLGSGEGLFWRTQDAVRVVGASNLWQKY